MSTKYELTKLPYEYGDLQPVISEQIVRLHHSKHHQGYVDGANNALSLLEDSRDGKIEINIKHVLRDLSFNLNGHLLHDVFWKNMRKPVENNQPTGDALKALEGSFGSFEAFKKQFSDAGKSVEGSGWVVLCMDEKKDLFIMQIEKHNLYSLSGMSPILVNDVWEHAYYLDYQNDRAKYIENWWSVVNWDDVSGRITG